MNIGSATQSTQISTAMRQTAMPETKPPQQEANGSRDSSLLKVQPVPAKPIPAAVGKGMGLLVDVSV